MKDILIKQFPHMLHGADYNPEQWQDAPEVLTDDMRLMRLANMNEMTLGVFSWSVLEPQEGTFDFSFLDRAMDDIYAAGGRVILATPSGGKPVWLAKRYPEVCRVDENGVRNEFGGRHNHCLHSPVYRRKVQIINEKLAERYKDHPALIAWHLSNEYGNYYDFSGCYCENCRAEFQKWLKKKYGTIENLNHEWWTRFWSHTFSSFEEIDPPSQKTDFSIHARNLDWKRFQSDGYIEFMNLEKEPLKRITPDIPVTTNLMELFDGIDYRKLARDLDFVSWDNYPRWKGAESDIELAQKIAFSHDFIRTLKKRPFLLMESTPSTVNWQEYSKLKRPGMHALSSLQAVAHGSDSVQYFQFRKSRGGAEKFHGAVVDHCGHEHTRVFGDVAALGKRLQKMDEIVGTVPDCQTAIFHNIENKWALSDAQGFANRDKKYYDTLLSFYRPLWERGVNTDIIGAEDNFGKYKILIAPMLYMVDETLKQKLCNFVQQGGILVCTYMTGYVNENDLCHLGGFPAGELKDLFGIWNEEIDTLYPEERNTVLANGKTYQAVDYCEILHTNGAEVLGVYGSDFYKDSPAFTVNRFGKGKAYYIAFRSGEDFAADLVGTLLREAGVRSCTGAKLPRGVTAHSRTDGQTTYLFLENYSHEPATVELEGAWLDLEKEIPLSGKVNIEPLGTVVCKGTVKNTVNEKMNRRLVWQDEFEEECLDGTKWSTERLMFNPGLVYDNSENNLRIENGMLHMQVTRAGDKLSTCHSVTTKHHMLFRYGYVEMRAKLPYCRGAWPSFWLKGDTKYIRTKENRNNWFSEIDIVEVFSSPDTVRPNLHRWGKINGEEYHEMLGSTVAGQEKRYCFATHEKAANDFHTYGMLWEADKISFFVDDTLYFSAAIDEYCALLNEKRNDTLGFHDPHYLILNNEVFTKDLSWYPEGSAIDAGDDADFHYFVDYIRLYQDGEEEKLYLPPEI